MTTDLLDADLPEARVLPLRAPTLTERILTAIETLQRRAAEEWGAGSDEEMWMAIGGVNALLGVLDMISVGAV